MGNKEIYVLAVALITWAGVWVYLVRLDALAKRLEKQLREREEEAEVVAPIARAVEGDVGL